MSTVTPNASYIKPDPDGSIGTWDTELNATIDLVDAHDHTTGKGVRVPVAGLNMNADLGLSNFALTQAKALAMAAVTTGTVSLLSRCLFVNSADNELYWKTSGGALVQLTSGTSLNAALLGGFTGDYGAGGSTASFSSSTGIYNFLRAANHRANIDSADIRLFEGTSGITNAVKLRSPTGLAASYTLVFPTALPAATHPVMMSSAGQLSAPASITLPANGSITVSGTGSITVSGTGDFKHPARDIEVHPAIARVITATAPVFTSSRWESVTAGQGQLDYPILGLRVGDRITRIRLHGREGNIAGETFSGAMFVRPPSGTETSITSGKTSGITNADTFLEWTAADAGLSPTGYTVNTTDGAPFLRCTLAQTSAAAEVRIYLVEVRFDRP